MNLRYVSPFLCGSLLAAQAPSPAHAVLKPQAPASVLEEAQPLTRVISMGEKDIARLKTKLRYTTMLLLPKKEHLVDVSCGDKDDWVINGSENIVYIKPAKAGAQTNLNLLTSLGNVYSFMLSDVSEGSAQPDLKVFVEAKEGMLDGPVRFVSVDQLSTLTSQVATAKAEADEAKTKAVKEVDKFVAEYPVKLKKYDVKLNKAPFYVTEMYHDNRFTFINLRAEETPVLYEVKDGKPNLVTFEYNNGVLAVGKILGDGYLAIGKQRLSFTRKD